MSHLTPAQLTTLKAAILAETDPTFVALRVATNETGMAAWYNADTVPVFVAWRTKNTLLTIGAGMLTLLILKLALARV